MKTFLNKQRKKLNTFHQTTFPFRLTWKLLLIFVAMYVVLSFLTVWGGYYLLKSVPDFNQGTLSIIQFVIIELLPVMLIGLVLARRYRKMSPVSETSRWAKRFAGDFWRHKTIIGVSVVILLIGESAVNIISAKLFFYGLPKMDANEKLLLAMMRRNWLFLAVTAVIGPVTEELVFRFWLTDVCQHLLTSAWSSTFTTLFRHVSPKLKRRADEFAYWIAAFVSALIFASLHMRGQSMALSLGYIFAGLFLQAIKKKTSSLTAPVMVHSISNIIVTAVQLA